MSRQPSTVAETEHRPTCERCRRENSDLRSLYIGFVQQKTDTPSVLPLKRLRLEGGVIEICRECHGEWLAAIKTWYENPTELQEDSEIHEHRLD